MSVTPDPELLDLGEIPVRPVKKARKTLQTRVWTATKAKLIARYIRLFVYITRHGTYLDAFAGPQDMKQPDTWAANLVMKLHTKDPWIRRFVLFEQDPQKLPMLRDLEEQSGCGRPVEIHEGDCNQLLPAYLEQNPLKEKEATFCLLDQHTFECHWETVRAVAAHKPAGKKIEIFYFLAVGWFERGWKNLTVDQEGQMTRWWGRDDWRVFADLPHTERPHCLAERFCAELGYAHANCYPIFKTSDAGRIMFYMIHASDHDEAPELMTRAYNNAMKELQPDQIIFEEVKEFLNGPLARNA